MIETIKSIILDFQETRLETGVPRRLRIEAVHGKAAVCIGVRRSGKSTYMFQVIGSSQTGWPCPDNDNLHGILILYVGNLSELWCSSIPDGIPHHCFFWKVSERESLPLI